MGEKLTKFKKKETRTQICIAYFNPFQLNVPFLYCLKTSENFWFSHTFREYRNAILVLNGWMGICPHWTPNSMIYVHFFLHQF